MWIENEIDKDTSSSTDPSGELWAGGGRGLCFPPLRFFNHRLALGHSKKLWSRAQRKMKLCLNGT